PHLSVDRFRLCRTRVWIYFDERFCKGPAVAFLCIRRCGGDCADLSFEVSRFAAVAALSGVRLLAHQSKFLHDSSRHAASSPCFCLCLVPLGTGPARIQSANSAWQYFPAGLLGAHRICVWTIQHPAQKKLNDRRRICGSADNLSCNVGVVTGANLDKRPLGGFALVPGGFAKRVSCIRRTRGTGGSPVQPERTLGQITTSSLHSERQASRLSHVSRDAPATLPAQVLASRNSPWAQFAIPQPLQNRRC